MATTTTKDVMDLFREAKSKAEQKTEQKAEQKAEPKTEPKIEQKAEPKIEQKAEPLPSAFGKIDTSSLASPGDLRKNKEERIFQKGTELKERFSLSVQGEKKYLGVGRCVGRGLIFFNPDGRREEIWDEDHGQLNPLIQQKVSEGWTYKSQRAVLLQGTTLTCSSDRRSPVKVGAKAHVWGWAGKGYPSFECLPWFNEED